MNRRTIHLVYAPGNHICAPFSITNEVAARLREHYEVIIHDFEGSDTILPKPGDVLLGHPHPKPGKTFANSFWQSGWSKRIPLIPFSFGLPSFQADFDGYLDPLVEHADCFLAICGTYWSQTLKESVFSHWESKYIQVDLAVRRDHYPVIKDRFNPAGSRRFVYIGTARDYKGTNFLAKLARHNRNLDIGWIGLAPAKYKNIQLHGQMDFAEPAAKELLKSYDFLLTCGRSDANPTTILEAAAWGMIPVCTPQSGYWHEDWFANIPLDDVKGASKILQALNVADQSKLMQMQQSGIAALDRHYNWDRFANQVIEAIESPAKPTLPPEEWQAARKKNQDRLRWFRVRRALQAKLVAIKYFYESAVYKIKLELGLPR
jgi:hypothetical protein